MQMVLTPNDLFSWNNKYSKYMVILLRYIHYNGLVAHLPAMHIDLLCACWYSWAVKGSSSLFFCRLLISLRFTSCLLLSPKLTDAPYSGPGTPPPSTFKMASSFTGSAHSHFPGYKTISIIFLNVPIKGFIATYRVTVTLKVFEFQKSFWLSNCILFYPIGWHFRDIVENLLRSGRRLPATF